MPGLYPRGSDSMAWGGSRLLRRLWLLLVTHTMLRTLAPWEAGGVLGARRFPAAGLVAPCAQGLVKALAWISGVTWGRALWPG